MSLAPALELRGVRAGYGRIEVLHGVDLVVPEATVVALLGPNGAGKSTTLKVASGQLAPSGGELLLAGQDVTGAPAEELVAVGVCAVPEGRGVFPNLSVRENIQMMTFTGTSMGEAEERAYGRFPKLGERRSQLAGTMSGGEQQMLAMARALVADPAVLLLDELSMGLAPQIVEELYTIVAAIAAEGISVLVVEQFAATALAVADLAAIMQQGRITVLGEPEDVRAELQGAYLGGGATA